MRDNLRHFLPGPIPRRAAMRRLVMLALVAGLAALPALYAATATANPAGPNGQILFGRYDPNLDDTVLYTINPDGTHEQQVLPLRPGVPTVVARRHPNRNLRHTHLRRRRDDHRSGHRQLSGDTGAGS